MLTAASIVIGRMSPTPFKLTRVHRRAGIIQVLSQNFDGSYNCLVDLGQIVIDNNKANPRPHSKLHEAQIISDWDEMCVRNPILRFDSGQLTTIDGRHTTKALIKQGYTEATCNVHFNITDAEAARIFYYLTTNAKRIDPWDAYICAVESGMRHALDIEAMLKRHGIKSPKDDSFNLKTADIKSYTVLHEAWDGGTIVLRKFCYLLSVSYKNAQGRIEYDARSVGFVRGFLDFIQDHEFSKLDINTLADYLERATASEIFNYAKNMAHRAGADRPNRGHFKRVFSEIVWRAMGKPIPPNTFSGRRRAEQAEPVTASAKPTRRMKFQGTATIED